MLFFVCFDVGVAFLGLNILKTKLTIQMTVITTPMSISHFPSIGSIKSLALRGCKIPINPIIITPTPAPMKAFSHRASIKTPNTTISINAVGFAIVAKAKKIPDTMRYLRELFTSLSTSLSLSVHFVHRREILPSVPSPLRRGLG